MPPLVFIYGDDVGISKDIWDIWEISIVPAHHNQMDRGKNVTAWLPKPQGEAVSFRRLVIFQCFNCRFDFLDGDICIQIRLGGELRNSSSYCQCVGCVERCGI